jgi:hypothetical protein
VDGEGGGDHGEAFSKYRPSANATISVIPFGVVGMQLSLENVNFAHSGEVPFMDPESLDVR